MGQKESEIETFKRLLGLYPTGILSVVSDTWDLWKVCTEYLPQLKEEILARDGKLVIRPDSGDPVDILCGFKFVEYLEAVNLFHSEVSYGITEGYCTTGKDGKVYKIEHVNEYPMGGLERLVLSDKPLSDAEQIGVIELLYSVFGGETNKHGYIELDSHIGAIYGDSITLDRAVQICKRLKAKGFASTNVVLGIGSYTYQYNTRDTFGFAVKATYGELRHDRVHNDNGRETEWQETEAREIFKDPITDDGTKKSKKGLLLVGREEDGSISCRDQQTWKQEGKGLLQTVFKDGKLVRRTTLEEIRHRLSL
jgi:nicotinamide phosphoribosyltransferase